MRIILLLFFFIPFIADAQFYNGSNQEFGKNRVQYFEFDWRSQNYERFKIYFYRGEDDYADYVSQTVQLELDHIENRLGVHVDDHLEILLFKSLGELRQSNIGLSNENMARYGGRDQIFGSKLMLYYEEDHAALNTQIREIIVETALRKLLFGNQWADVLIGNDPNKHPDWFINGIIGYLARPWDADFESKLKDAILSNRFENFSILGPEEAGLAGHAFWHFVEETYGKSQFMSILFLTRNIGHIDRTLEYLLGSNLEELLPEFNEYYKKRFLDDLNWQEEIAGDLQHVKVKKNEKLLAFTAAKDGSKFVYVRNKDGRYKIYLQNANEKKAKKLLAYEPRLLRIQDLTFPVFTFHPSGEYLVYFIERKGKLLFNLYDIRDHSTLKKEVPRLEKIISCDYSLDGKSIVISGVKNGQTDLYLYSIPGNSLDQLTDDLWDDLNPSWTADGKNILFSSNRIENGPTKSKEIKPIQSTYDLFSFPLDDKDRKRLAFERITETPDVNEKCAVELKNGNISYLSDANGLWNRWELKKDSTISFIDTLIHYRPDNKTFAVTNLNTGILSQNIISKTDEVLTTVFQNQKYKVLRSPLNHEPKESNLVYFKERNTRKLGPQLEEKPQLENENNPSIDSLNKQVIVSEDSRYVKQKMTLYQNDDEKKSTQKEDSVVFERATPQKYKINFAKDYLNARIDNSFLNQSYQIYSGPGSVYLNPSISGLLRISFSDLMEDVVFTGGMRIPTARNNSEFFMGIDFRKKQLDKQLYYYRRSYENRSDVGIDKVITHEIQLNLVHPFSEVFSVRGTVFSRTDIAHPLALNEISLLRKETYNYQGGLKGSLVFDNTRQWSENCWTGTRAKVFAEYLQGSQSKTFGMVNVGFDARHSIPLRKELVWVNRIAAGTSFGGQRLLYYMGGVDNWMLRPTVDFNSDIPVDPKGKFAYQTLATPMRGFVQNQRNGNSFAVFNSELRVPLFLLFTKGAIKNEPLRSFQLIGFFDLGSAWNGPSPFSEKNTFNEQIIENKPAVIKIENSREPIIAATGLGARTKIFGYFVRADVGWGIENLTFKKKPVVFLSLTHDI